MENLNKAVRSFRLTLLIIAGFSFFAALLQLTIPLYMLQIYDRVLPSNSSDTLLFLSILAAFALIILGLTEMVRRILGTRASMKIDAVLANDVLSRVIEEGHRTNGNTQPLRELQGVRALVGSQILIGIVDLPFSLVFIGCLYLIHPTLFWLTIMGVVILLVVAVVNLKVSEKPAEEQMQAAVVANRQSEFFARNSDSILAMGMLRDVLANWGKWNADTLVASDRAARINAIFSGFSRTLRFGIQAAMLGVGAWLVQRGEMTAGMIFAASIISGRALQPIDVVINSWPQITAGRKAWQKVRAFVSDSDARKEYTQVDPPKGHLTAEGILQPNPLDPKKPPILARVSFELPAGKSVAVIGPSGSGKSTLARIIVGAVKPFGGDIRIDGHNIANWDPQDLGQHIGYLAQDVEMLPGTIAQNISRFRPDANDADILKAAAMAHVEDLIKKMPNGYDTLIGPGGLSISGGEKQRIALARAFYGMPRVLVLDEPNSSLDRIGENALLRALVEARKNAMTVFLVTQRDTVIKVVDKIMRVQDGQIVDYGDRDEVIKEHAERVKAAARDKQQAAKPKITTTFQTQTE
ncbi:MAG: type I secretion system permease/ATPase [Pseudomonadota bacterium]